MSRQGDDSEHRRSADRGGDSPSLHIGSTSGGGTHGNDSRAPPPPPDSTGSASVHMGPRVEIVPDRTGTGFLPSSITAHQITATIKKLYDRPVKFFTDLTEEEKRRWYNEFKSHFIIRPELDDRLYTAFRHRAAKRLGDMYHDIRNNRRNTTHDWLSDVHLRVLREYWESDGFKRRSRTAKANRASEKGGSVHCGGSATIPSTEQRLARQLKRKPTVEEVFRETHMKKSNDQWVDERAERTHSDFMQRLAEAETQYTQALEAGETPTPVDDTAVWQDTVGGPNKNRIYGLGTHRASCVTSSGASATSAAQYSTPTGSAAAEAEAIREHVHRLVNVDIPNQHQEYQRQLAEMEQKLRAEHAAEKEVMRKEIQKSVREKVQKQMEKKIEKKLNERLIQFFTTMNPSASLPPELSKKPVDSSDDEDDDDFS